MAAAKKKTAHERVMAFVERELKKNPDIKSAELQEKAKKVSRVVSGLTVRQFHAKYPLQVKRRSGSTKKSRKRKSTPKVASASQAREASRPNREAVRKALLAFAKDLSDAETQTQTIDVLANLDKYVDRVVKAAD